MEIDAWYQWLFLRSYYLAQVLFVIGVFVLARKSKSKALYMCALGSISFMLGNYLMIEVEKEAVDLLHALDSNDSLRFQYLVGRGLSAMGYLLSSISLLVYSVRYKLNS